VTTTALSDGVGARIADRVAQSLGQRKYDLWFDRTAEIEYSDEDHTLTVAVPSRFFADRIGQQFDAALRTAAADETGEQVQLEVRVEPDRFAGLEVRVNGNGHTPAPPATGRPADAHANGSGHAPADAPRNGSGGPTAAAPPAPTADPLNAYRRAGDRGGPAQGLRLRHTLEEFVVGACNELAFAAARRLADAEAFTEALGGPLFIHGGCGLGKTHLLQGVCREMVAANRKARVVYTTGERFTNQYIGAVAGGKLEPFRKRMRELDLLAVDDVHFIAGKTKTQQEFLHSFDEIDLSGARLILASDHHPRLIEQFSEALRSRCVRGLVAEVKPPDAEMRRLLVRRLAERKGMILRDPAVEALASRVTRSVREIEGQLSKLYALASLANPNSGRSPRPIPEPVGLALVNRLFEVEEASRVRRPVSYEQVLGVVAERFGLTPGKVTSNSRHRHVVLARSLAIHLTRQLTAMSYPEIAKAMGRNHSTIITADQRMQRQLEANQPVNLPYGEAASPVELLGELKQRLRG